MKLEFIEYNSNSKQLRFKIIKNSNQDEERKILRLRKILGNNVAEDKGVYTVRNCDSINSFFLKERNHFLESGISEKNWNEFVNQIQLSTPSTLQLKLNTILPADLREHIIYKYLSIKDLAMLSAVSRLFRDETKHPAYCERKLIATGCNEALVKKTIETGAIFNYQNLLCTFSRMPLVVRKQVANVWELLCLSGEVNAINYAIQYEHVDANTTNARGENALHLAAYSGSIAGIERVACIPRINLHTRTAEYYGKTALHFAVRSENPEAVILLRRLCNNLSYYPDIFRIIDFCCKDVSLSSALRNALSVPTSEILDIEDLKQINQSPTVKEMQLREELILYYESLDMPKAIALSRIDRRYESLKEYTSLVASIKLDICYKVPEKWYFFDTRLVLSKLARVLYNFFKKNKIDLLEQHSDDPFERVSRKTVYDARREEEHWLRFGFQIKNCDHLKRAFQLLAEKNDKQENDLQKLSDHIYKKYHEEPWLDFDVIKGGPYHSSKSLPDYFTEMVTMLKDKSIPLPLRFDAAELVMKDILALKKGLREKFENAQPSLFRIYCTLFSKLHYGNVAKVLSKDDKIISYRKKWLK